MHMPGGTSMQPLYPFHFWLPWPAQVPCADVPATHMLCWWPADNQQACLHLLTAQVPWKADSTPSFLTFAGPHLENVAKWKRVLHYCQLPLTTQGTGPFQCFWFLLPLKVYWVIISKGCCFLILSGKQLKDCFWRLIVAVYLRSSLSSPSNLTNKLPNYGNALKHSPFLSLSAREK